MRNAVDHSSPTLGKWAESLPPDRLAEVCRLARECPMPLLPNPNATTAIVGAMRALPDMGDTPPRW